MPEQQDQDIEITSFKIHKSEKPVTMDDVSNAFNEMMQHLSYISGRKDQMLSHPKNLSDASVLFTLAWEAQARKYRLFEAATNFIGQTLEAVQKDPRKEGEA